jgi:predicted phage gp36 major capsid-like protein
VRLFLIGLIGVGVATVVGLVGGATFQAARYFRATAAEVVTIRRAQNSRGNVKWAKRAHSGQPFWTASR